MTHLTETLVEIPDNSLVLFQGDSITDADRNQKFSPDLGLGYAMLASTWFSAMHPEKRVRFLNRGISGNRIEDLKDRWNRDCLSLKPDVVSLLVGVNDADTRFFWGHPTSVERFEADYRDILEQTRNALDARIVLLEPFMLDIEERPSKMREYLNPLIDVVRKLSKEYNAVLVPLDDIFAQAAEKREPSFWTDDGIHPTFEGHALIAQAWLDRVADI